MDRNYQELEEKYKVLEEKYTTLVEECKENVIMQSMNEMKTRYDNMLKNTVPSYKYNTMAKKHEMMYTTLISCGVIIDHIMKIIKNFENRPYDTAKTLQAQLELMMLKEIIEEVM
jgi:hypothetical protein